MSVFQIHVLENEANIPSSPCWNCLWTLWSHLLFSPPEWQQAPLRQPAEILSASLGCPGCRTQTKSRSSHSSGLQKPSWGQRVEYKTGGWWDIFGSKWTLFLKVTADALAVQQGREKVHPREKVTPSLLWQTQLPSYPGSRQFWCWQLSPPSQLHPFILPLHLYWLPLFSQPAFWWGMRIWQCFHPHNEWQPNSHRPKKSSCSCPSFFVILS